MKNQKSTKRMVALMLSFALALIILPSICYASEVSSSNDFRKVQNYKEGMFVDVNQMIGLMKTFLVCTKQILW